MKMETLADLLAEQLQDLYDAEHQIVVALPKLADAALSTELKAAFDDHRAQTQQHIQRLQQVFDLIGISARRKHCKGIEGLLKEGAEMASQDIASAVRDAGLIASAQRVEHYEMAGYGTIRTYARVLDYPEAAQLLQETLDEEELADKRLTHLANSINLAASQG